MVLSLKCKDTVILEGLIVLVVIHIVGVMHNSARLSVSRIILQSASGSSFVRALFKDTDHRTITFVRTSQSH